MNRRRSPASRTSSPASRGTTGRTTSRRRTPSGRAPATRRRSTRTSATSRRRRPSTATTLGSAFALALIALFTRASWPARIVIVVVALVAVAGYLVVRSRRGDDPAADSPQDDDAPTPGPTEPPPADKDLSP